MKQPVAQLALVAASVSALLLTAGCKSGGGGIFGGLFGGSSESGVDALSSLFSGEGDSGSSGSGSGSTAGGGEQAPGGENYVGGTPPVATLHHPEPGSLVLFGGGLVGAAFLRRRKSRKPSSP